MMVEPHRDDEDFQGTREELDRAVSRLDLLEWMILGFAVLVALVGGAFIAFLLSSGTGLSFGSTWVVVSILLLAVPGAIVFARERRRG